MECHLTIHNAPPVVWSTTNQTISTEKLNRNILTARTEAEGFAAKRWHRFQLETRLVTTTGSQFIVLPSIAGFEYIVDNITLYGSYTGTPTITYGSKSYVLPAVSTAELYTILPGDVIAGSDWAVPYIIATTGGTSINMRALINLRICRSTASPIFTANADVYSENDTLTAARFLAQKAEIDSFCSTWSTAIKPIGIHYIHFEDFSSTMSSIGLTDRLPGFGGEKVIKVFARIVMQTTGSIGQNLTIDAGYGATTLMGVVSLAGLSSATFATGTIALTDTVRVPAVAGDDFIVNVSTNTTTTIKSVDLFIVHQKP